MNQREVEEVAGAVREHVQSALGRLGVIDLREEVEEATRQHIEGQERVFRAQCMVAAGLLGIELEELAHRGFSRGRTEFGDILLGPNRMPVFRFPDSATIESDMLPVQLLPPGNRLEEALDPSRLQWYRPS